MKFRRIVLGLGAQPSEAALAIAADLARATDAALLGLFVEESDLLHLAALPFARELALSAVPARALDAPAMERALRSRARAEQARLTRRLEGATFAWTFEVARGSVVSSVLEVAGEGDLAVLSLTGGAMVGVGGQGEAALRGLKDVRGPVLLVGDRHALRAPVVAVLTGPVATAETLASLGALARHCGGALSLLALPGAAPDADAIDAVRGVGIGVRLRTLADAAPDRLLRELKREHPGLVVLCDGETGTAAGAGIIAELGCPLLLLPA